MRTLIISTFVILLFSCKENKTNNPVNIPTETITTNHPPYVEKIETAHKKSKFAQMQTVCFNIEMTFGASTSKFKVFSTPNSSSIKIEKANGITSIYKDGIFYTNADSTMWKREQFSLFTYQYFFMIPYKLSDQGTNWKKLPTSTYNDIKTNTAQLTFNNDVGDSPNDWYIIHSDQKTNLISYMGYIVTGGGMSQEEAEKNAHSIKYENYHDVDGVPISQHWKFYDYSKESGLGTKQIGEGKLKNVIFMHTFEDTYDTSDLKVIK